MTPVGSSNKCDNCFANKTQNFEITAQYQFDFGLRPEISYLQSKGKDLSEDMGFITNKYNNNKDLVKYVSIGANYYFNKTSPPTLITKSTCLTAMMHSTTQSVFRLMML